MTSVAKKIKDLQSSVLKIRTELIENCFIVNFNTDIKEIAVRIKQKATIKEPVSVYFDSNPHDGLLETT